MSLGRDRARTPPALALLQCGAERQSSLPEPTEALAAIACPDRGIMADPGGLPDPPRRAHGSRGAILASSLGGNACNLLLGGY